MIAARAFLRARSLETGAFRNSVGSRGTPSFSCSARTRWAASFAVCAHVYPEELEVLVGLADKFALNLATRKNSPATSAWHRSPSGSPSQEGIVEDQPVQRRLDAALRQPALELELVGEAVTGDCPRPAAPEYVPVEFDVPLGNQARVQEASGQLQGHLLQGDRSQVPEADRFSHQREQQLPAPVYGLRFRGLLGALVGWARALRRWATGLVALPSLGFGLGTGAHRNFTIAYENENAGNSGVGLRLPRQVARLAWMRLSRSRRSSGVPSPTASRPSGSNTGGPGFGSGFGPTGAVMPASFRSKSANAG
eukprot:tig00020801_g13989.t1